MRGGIDSRRRRILRRARNARFFPVSAFAQGQRDAGKNRGSTLYRGADREKRILEGRKKSAKSSSTLPEPSGLGADRRSIREEIGVKVQLWRSSSEKVLQRAVAEARAGRFQLRHPGDQRPGDGSDAPRGACSRSLHPHFKDLPPAAFQASPLRRRPASNFFTIA